MRLLKLLSVSLLTRRKKIKIEKEEKNLILRNLLIAIAIMISIYFFLFIQFVQTLKFLIG